MFRGQLYAGRLYAGRLFGVEETVTPQPELPLEYHGGGDEAIILTQILINIHKNIKV